MSRLEELIQEYCPDGVRFLSIGECTLKTTNIKWKLDTASHQYIDLTSVDRDTHEILETVLINKDNAPSRAQQLVQTGDILFGGTRPMLKRYCIVPEEYNGEICSTGFCVLRPNNSIILSKWLFHIVATSDFYAHVEKYQKGASYPAITDAEVKMFSIPVPPLRVQEEIVRILDSFTQLTAELQAELQARKRQYEYYLNRIINSIDAEELKLGDVCSFTRGPFGGSLKKECFQQHGYAVYEQQHAIYSSMEIRYFISEEKFQELKRFEVKQGDLIVSCSGTIGKVFIIPSNAPVGIINQALLKLTPSKRIDAKYLKYYFENTISAQLNDAARGGAIRNVPSVAELKNLNIRVPSISEQKKIVSVLDHFNTLCNDLTSGLPAEIEARQKQYEYYRDKLLTFKPLP